MHKKNAITLRLFSTGMKPYSHLGYFLLTMHDRLSYLHVMLTVPSDRHKF